MARARLLGAVGSQKARWFHFGACRCGGYSVSGHAVVFPKAWLGRKERSDVGILDKLFGRSAGQHTCANCNSVFLFRSPGERSPWEGETLGSYFYCPKCKKEFCSECGFIERHGLCFCGESLAGKRGFLKVISRFPPPKVAHDSLIRSVLKRFYKEWEEVGDCPKCGVALTRRDIESHLVSDIGLQMVTRGSCKCLHCGELVDLTAIQSGVVAIVKPST